MFKIIKSKDAFSLVELIIAMAITGILFLGVSVFFAQHLGQLNDLQAETDAGRDHFILQELLRKKLMDAQGASQLSQEGVILKNTAQSKTPFTFIGQQEDKVVIKDFFLLHSVTTNKATFDFNDVPLATGMAYWNSDYYVASFSENAIYNCEPNGDCKLIEGIIESPLGVATNGNSLFITQPTLGKVLKANPQAIEDQLLVSDEFKQPTGVAYYQNDDEKEYLFVADVADNVVKRIDLDTDKVEIVVGLSSDPTCNSSALFCGLNFPTGLAIYGNSLYIADSGNGRILKMSEPELVAGETTNAMFEFQIDPSILLEKFNLIGSFGGETVFDPENSNLVGGPNNYNAGTKVFNNSIFDPAPIDGCQLSENLYTQQNLQSIGFEVGDFIGFGGDLFEINSFEGQTDCQTSEEEDASPIYRHVTRLSGSVASKGDQFGYGANYANDSGQVTLALDDLHFDEGGFQTIAIETEDFQEGEVVETDEILMRIGNGTLGSVEDEVEVWLEGLTYPTGVGVDENNNQLWVLDGKERTLTQFSLKDKSQAGQSPFPELDVSDYAPFDFMSGFDVPIFNLSEPQENLLELSFEADLDESEEGEKWETYTLNKALEIE